MTCLRWSYVLMAVSLLCHGRSRDGIQLWAADAVSSSVEDKIEGAILGCLVADALTLGSSFESDAQKIKDAYFRERKKDYGGLRYHAPGDLFHGHHNYHKTRKDGDQTDHGDNNIYLLEYFSKLGLKKTIPFDISHYVKKYWIHIYKGHQKGECRACGAKIDPAVKTFLENLEKGKSVEESSADSNAHVIRFAGALAVYHGDDEMLDRIAALTTEFTHGHHESSSAAVFWARTVHRVIDGMEPQEAVVDAAKSMQDNSFIVTKVNEAMYKVQESRDPQSPLSKEEFCDDLAVTSMGMKWTPGTEPRKIGKSSNTAGSFPAAVYFIIKYGGESFSEAVQANVMVGGDSSSRAIPIGMVLGAHYGLQEGIPRGWIQTLHTADNVKKMLKPLMKGLGGAKPRLHEEL